MRFLLTLLVLGAMDLFSISCIGFSNTSDWLFGLKTSSTSRGYKRNLPYSISCFPSLSFISLTLTNFYIPRRIFNWLTSTISSSRGYSVFFISGGLCCLWVLSLRPVKYSFFQVLLKSRGVPKIKWFCHLSVFLV